MLVFEKCKWGLDHQKGLKSSHCFHTRIVKEPEVEKNKTYNVFMFEGAFDDYGINFDPI